MVSDFLAEYLGDDAALIISRSLLPFGIFLLILIARRLIPPFLKRVFGQLSRISQWINLSQTEFQEKALDIFVPPVRFVVTVTGLWLITLVLDLPSDVQRDFNTVYASLLLLAFYWAVFRLVDTGFTVWYQRVRVGGLESRYDETLIQFLTRLAEATIVIFAFVTIMQQWGINLTGLLAGLGLGGLAVALAAQDALANLIGYLAIIGDQPFKVGDFIVSDKFEGVVEVIGFRTTQIRRPDRALIFVPNAVLANEVVTNWSQTIHGPKRGRVRLHITLGLTYDTTADQMETVVADIRQQMADHERVVPGSVVVHFVEFGASSLDVMIVAVARVRSWEQVQSTREQINLRLMRIVKAHGLDIAFPTRTVILEEDSQPTPVQPTRDTAAE